MSRLYPYSELRPDQLRSRLGAYPVAIVPWGALEWHGPHLPFGLDGLVAESFSEQLARQTGAILLPSTYLPITALPHPQSIGFTAEIVRQAVEELLQALETAGFRLVCLVSGHYAQGHELVLTEVAESLTRRDEIIVLTATPLALLDEPALLDHAGIWETSQLLAYRPDLVDLDSLPAGPLPRAGEVAVLGGDPREATAEQGQAVIERALQAWEAWIERLHPEGDPAPLFQLYADRRSSYQAYVDKYYDGSWESALQAWWSEHSG